MTLWLMLNTAAPGFSGALVECGLRHREAWPRASLSVNRSALRALALVKVAGADQAWLDDRSWPGVLVTSHTRAGHETVKATVQAVTWRERSVDEGLRRER